MRCRGWRHLCCAQTAHCSSASAAKLISSRIPGRNYSLRGDLVLQCQRCNSEMQYPLRRDVHFRFVGSDEELAALPIVDDDVEVIVGSHTMAVAPWVEDEAILSLPVVPRHEDCRALSPEAADADPTTDRPNPFAALADLNPGRKPR